MRSRTLLAAVALHTFQVHGQAQQAHGHGSPTFYSPVSFHIGSEVPEDPVGFVEYRAGSSITLNSSFPVVTFDYGAEVAGFPSFNVRSLSGLAQVELKYSEPYNGLRLLYSDGPL